MKLLNFPFLIQSEIIKSLDYSQIFFLSILSSNTAFIVRNVRLNVQKLRYFIDKPDTVVRVVTGENDEHMTRLVAMESVLAFSDENSIKLRLSDVVFDFRVKATISRKKNTHLTLIYLRGENESMIHQLQNHINHLFQSDLHIQLQVVSEFGMRPIAKINNVKESVILGIQFLDANLDHFFDSHPNQESVRITYYLDTLNNLSPLFSINNLVCHRAHSAASKLIDNFNGRCLWIQDAHIQMFQFLELIRKWVRNEAYHNLKVIDCLFDEPFRFNDDRMRDQFFDEIGAVEWSAAKRPQHYVLNEKAIDAFFFPKTWVNNITDCKQFWDVEQQNGGRKLASIHFLRNQFRFLTDRPLYYTHVNESPLAFMPSSTVQVLDKHVKKEDVLVFLEYNHPQFPDNRTMLLPIGGINIRLSYSKTPSINRKPRSHLQYLKIAEDRLIASIQDHMNFIYPRLNDRKLVIVSYDDPKFEKFKNLNEIRLIWGDVPAEKMETLKMDHPELKRIQVGFNWMNFVNHSLLQSFNVFSMRPFS